MREHPIGGLREKFRALICRYFTSINGSPKCLSDRLINYRNMNMEMDIDNGAETKAETET